MAALLGLLAMTACAPSGTQAPAAERRLWPTTSPGASSPAAQATPVPPAVPAPERAEDRARAGVDVPARPPARPLVRPLVRRQVPDVLVVGPLSASVRSRLVGLSPAGGATSFGAGPVVLAGRRLAAMAVDPSAFRAFTASGTAEAGGVWEAVARGEAVVSHEAARAHGLELGADVAVSGPAGGATLRLGALATTGLPASDVVVADQVGGRLGVPAGSGLLLTAPAGQDVGALAAQVRAVAGAGAAVDLLTTPAADPVASLTGGRAAQDLGAFSYRYYPDGTIEPDRAWVAANIRTEQVPLLGRVTCHRLMLPQLRGALQDVVDAGLGGALTTYDGCYVPRFIERNPDRPISLHTWGIAIDLDAATNFRGIRGTMDARVVAIFKRWGFAWGGDWKYTDPMHFELGTLLDAPRR